MGQVKILKLSKLLVAIAKKIDRRCSYGSKGDYENGNGFYGGSSSLVFLPPNLVLVPKFLGKRTRWANSIMDKGNDLYDTTLCQQCRVSYKVGFEPIKMEGIIVRNQPNEKRDG
ncbi:hypothetical protein Golob_005914 [Gossypium lobatum]|uniref:Uncharacterized protein n=1 Tax=Gossypium lobatum TaxID=34289 RepID=A0A7J8MUM9_9ROSI|nr:hypothetical protein [Gossypium lobatum]